MDHRHEIKKFVLQNFLFCDDETMLSDGESMIKKGIVDPTAILELISHLEETWGITIIDKEMIPANFESIDAITAFVARKEASRSVPAP